jgi:heme oxygenase
MPRLCLVVAVACVCVGAAPARAEWSGDGPADVLAVDTGGRLLMYRATATGRFAPGGGQPIGTGWGSFTALLAPGDWSGDGKPDLLARASDGRLLMYRGNGSGGFLNGHGEQIGSGWQSLIALLVPRDWNGDRKPDILARASDGRLQMYRGNGSGGFLQPTAQQIGSGWQCFTALLAPGDWNGDGKQDILGRASDGRLLMYRGNGSGGFLQPTAQQIGTGWQGFTALLAPGDWNGDGRQDILGRTSDGRLLMYRGNGSGGFLQPTAQQIGSGWQSFNALFAGGDFSGDGKPDILARDANGLLFVYRGNGRGGFVTGQRERIGSGWGSLGALTLVWDPRPAAPPPPPPPAPPSVPLTNGTAKLYAGKHCTRPGGRLKVRMRIRRHAGRRPARVLFVVFFVRHGSRRVDHRRPFVVRLRMNQRPGKRGRVYARVFYRRSGSRTLRHKTVSRKFKMCRRAR